ncbi:MAG: Asp-tRNA(Asn)/Glu-tRNA(Gln) amidotransferase subunit GatB [Anaerolineales bacterium]
MKDFSKSVQYEAVIGLEIHAELETRSKMFCACPVVDITAAPPNSAVCPVCAGMPGVLPVINQRAVEYALRVALALDCEVNRTSIFARKNYFYPDLPKGYQISQYEQPLARNGRLTIRTSKGERVIRIRRVHLEEETGKSTHVEASNQQISKPEIPNPQSPIPNHQLPITNYQITDSQPYSLIDLNRAGVPLLEIVTEPDLHTAEEVRAYAAGLRAILCYLGVNSGDMQRGVLRIEPNISVRPVGSDQLGTRAEVKNLNSFRALERAVEHEIDRQIEILCAGGRVVQETVGWDESQQTTLPQRSKEEAHDYRYFPEPDLPPLVVEAPWIEAVRATLPELPHPRFHRFVDQYGLSKYDAGVLVTEKVIADYFEQTVKAAPGIDPKTITNWITGELFGLLNQAGLHIGEASLTPAGLGELLRMVQRGEINNNTAKKVLAEALKTGALPESVVESRGLKQISDTPFITGLVQGVLADHPEQVQTYLDGKEAVANWLFGQVMRRARGRANPQVVRGALETRLAKLKKQ